jgi:hypothetical protein
MSYAVFCILLFIALTAGNKLFTIINHKVVRHCLLKQFDNFKEFREILGAIFSLIPKVCKIFSNYL